MQTSDNAKSCCMPSEGTAPRGDRISAAQFSGDKRVHISLNVRNVKRSLPFYRALFDQDPIKIRDDYAKFEVDEPSVNFAINEHPDAVDRDGHFGVEVKHTDVVQNTYNRFKGLGIHVDATETQVACCYSVQDKIWAVDPDGNRWEVFVVTANEADEGCGATCICYNPDTGRCNWV